MMADESVSQSVSQPDFAALYAGQRREAVCALAGESLASGADAAAQARDYAARGKPDFALAYLLECELSEAEKRAIYAESFERRAALTEGKAREFDAKFHRPFPLLASDAAQDRGRARQVRAGKQLSKGAGKQIPLI